MSSLVSKLNDTLGHSNEANLSIYNSLRDISQNIYDDTSRSINTINKSTELFNLNSLLKLDLSKRLKTIPTIGEFVDKKVFMSSMGDISGMVTDIMKNPLEYGLTAGLTWGLQSDYARNIGPIGKIYNARDNLPAALYQSLTESESTLNRIIESSDGKGMMKSFVGRFLKNSRNNLLKNHFKYMAGDVITARSEARSSKVNFDAETHVSINKVIPGYLSKILSAYNDEEELVYDYATGKWDKSSVIKAKIENEDNIRKVSKKDTDFFNKLLNITGNKEERSLKLLKDLIELRGTEDKGAKLKDFNRASNIKSEDLLKLKEKGYSEEEINAVRQLHGQNESAFRRSLIKNRYNLSEVLDSQNITGTIANIFANSESKSSISNVTGVPSKVNIPNNKDSNKDFLADIGVVISDIRKLLSNKLGGSFSYNRNSIINNITNMNYSDIVPSLPIPNTGNSNSSIIDNSMMGGLGGMIPNLMGSMATNEEDLISIDELEQNERSSPMDIKGISDNIKNLTNLVSRKGSTTNQTPEKGVVKSVNDNTLVVGKQSFKPKDLGESLGRMIKGVKTGELYESNVEKLSAFAGLPATAISKFFSGSNLNTEAKSERDSEMRKSVDALFNFGPNNQTLFTGILAGSLAGLLAKGLKRNDKTGGLMGFLGNTAKVVGGVGLGTLGLAGVAKFLPSLLPAGVTKLLSSFGGVGGLLSGGLKMLNPKNLGKALGHAFKGVGSLVRGAGSLLGKGASAIFSGIGGLFGRKSAKATGKAAKATAPLLTRVMAKMKSGGAVSKIFSTLGKGKGLGKILGKGGKIAGKVASRLPKRFLAKGAGRLLGMAIPGAGWALTLGLMAPDIIKTVKNPMKSLKSPLKTLGSLFGFTKHPADELEEEAPYENLLNSDSEFNAEIKEIKQIDPNIVIETEEKTEYANMLRNVARKMFMLSPMFMVNKLSSSAKQEYESIDKNTIEKESVNIGKRTFDMTPIGGLYNLANNMITRIDSEEGVMGMKNNYREGVNGKVSDWIAKLFGKFAQTSVLMAARSSNMGMAGGMGYGTVGAAEFSDMGSTELVGGDTAQQSWNFLRQKGFSEEQSAGILGNMRQESSMRPDTIQSGQRYDESKALNPNVHGYGLGIVQWDGSRRADYIKYAKSKGKPWQDLGTQLDFMWHELQTTERLAYNAVKSASTIEAAQLAFLRKYERAGIEKLDTRNKYSREFYNQLSGKAVPSRTSTAINNNDNIPMATRINNPMPYGSSISSSTIIKPVNRTTTSSTSRLGNNITRNLATNNMFDIKANEKDSSIKNKLNSILNKYNMKKGMTNPEGVSGYIDNSTNNRVVNEKISTIVDKPELTTTKTNIIEDGNSEFDYDFKALWSLKDIVDMVKDIDTNILKSNDELQLLLEEIGGA